jgi:hypothetical protein
MDDADTGLEIGAKSTRHPVRRQGVGVNTSYTVNLTPPNSYAFGFNLFSYLIIQRCPEKTVTLGIKAITASEPFIYTKVGFR